jgi:anti-sigma B factor antagonist
MLIETKNIENITFVTLPDRLVYANADEIRHEIFELIETGHHCVALNLFQVEFIDSSGLAALVASFKKIDFIGGQMALVTPSDNARMLIELTRLHQVFDIYEDLESAVYDLVTTH